MGNHLLARATRITHTTLRYWAHPILVGIRLFLLRATVAKSGGSFDGSRMHTHERRNQHLLVRECAGVFLSTEHDGCINEGVMMKSSSVTCQSPFLLSASISVVVDETFFRTQLRIANDACDMLVNV